MLILHLLDIEKSKDALYGIALEIEDLASHVVLGKWLKYKTCLS